MKLISLIFMITIPYHFFTGIFDFFNSGSVAKDGVPRTQPFVNPILMPMVIKDDNRKVVPATNLIPKEVAAKLLSPTNPEIAKQNKYASENESWFESFSNTYFGGIGAFLAVAKMLRDVQTKLPQIIDKKYGLTNPATALASAKDAATGALKGAIPIDPSQVSSFEVTNPLKAGLPDPKKALASVVPAVPSPAKYTDLVESMKVPLPGPQLPPTLMKQAGGGDEGGLDSIFLWGVGALVLGGFALTFFRKMVVPKRKDENEYPRKTYERDDAPPNPGGV